MKKHIPNIITMGNLLMGCFSIVASSERDFEMAAIFILVAAVFDFFDGFIARLLKVQSPLGKELDSLSDCVSFGVAPSMILFFFFFKKIHLFNSIGSIEIAGKNFDIDLYLVLFSTFFIALFSAIRLAKFNLDDRQTNHFIGLPTPANALFIICVPFMFEQYIKHIPLEAKFLNSFTAIGLCIILSYLLVSPIPFMALKFKNFSLLRYKFHLLFALLSAMFIIILGFLAAPIVLLLYYIISKLYFYSRKKDPYESR